MTPVLEARGLSARYGQRTILHEITFTLEPGSVVGLVGSNGAGKTTLINRILGLVSGQGDVTWGGASLAPGHSPSSDTVAVVWDTLRMHPGLRTMHYLRSLAAALGLPQTRPAEVLDLVDLARAAHARIGQLSMGMRQRLGIAAALMARPGCLILDEPGNGLDPEGIEWLARLVCDFASSGGAVLMSSHQLAQLENVADRVLILDSGRLVSDAAVTSLTSGAVVSILDCEHPERMVEAINAGGGRVLPGRSVQLRVVGLDQRQVAELAHEHGGIVWGLYQEAPSLADTYHDLLASSRKELR